MESMATVDILVNREGTDCSLIAYSHDSYFWNHVVEVKTDPHDKKYIQGLANSASVRALK